MDWQQKLAAIEAFAGGVSLRMRKPGDWYVDALMEIGGDGFLRGEYGNGPTPEAAIEEHWRIYSELPPGRYAVASETRSKGRRGRWNGYMWELLTEEDVEAFRQTRAA